MKRILLSVFAAAITAAWALPATTASADVDFSGQYRVRGEYTNNNDYNDDASDATDFWGQKVRLTAKASASDDTSFKITIQDTRNWGSGVNTEVAGEDNDLDVHEAYVNISDIFGTPVSARIGRQELAFGNQRLIGHLNWSNNARAFDGARFTIVNDAATVDAFAMTVTEDLTGPHYDDTYLNGVHATLKQIPNNTLDVYLFHQTDGTDLTRYTLGARLAGSVAGLNYTAELPFQFGEQNATTDISAYAFAITANYTLPTPMKITIGAEYDLATGDEADSADENEAFNNLFPTNHGHFGIGDVVNTWSDLTAWSVNAGAALTDQLSVKVAYWNYTEDEVPTGADDDLGSEIDLVVNYKYSDAVGLQGGFARFTPGDRTSATPDDPRDWAYLMLTANF